MSAIKNFFEFVNYHYEKTGKQSFLFETLIEDTDLINDYCEYLQMFGIENDLFKYELKISKVLRSEDSPEKNTESIKILIKQLQAESKKLIKEYDPE